MVKQLFISKDIDELSELPAFCYQNNIKLIASSLIYFEPVPFILNSEFEVVFFSSIRAAHFFLENASIPKGVEIACVGMTTARKLTEKGFKISFIGNKSGRPDEVALEFAEWLGERKVLIPCSIQSKRTISSRVPINQLVEIEVYKTLSNCESIPPSDYYIFTSPSNLVSFLSCNSKPQGEIIAWGSTTKSFILESNLITSYTLEKSCEEDLINYLFSK
jgi:uroporphyrinogen-III synthase